jgi:hypothetical protein
MKILILEHQFFTAMALETSTSLGCYTIVDLITPWWHSSTVSDNLWNTFEHEIRRLTSLTRVFLFLLGALSRKFE